MVKIKVSQILIAICLVYLRSLKVCGTQKEVEKISNVDSAAEVVPQPCKPNDSCRNRCVNDPQHGVSTRNKNVTVGQFNCFCDSDCETFG